MIYNYIIKYYLDKYLVLDLKIHTLVQASENKNEVNRRSSPVPRLLIKISNQNKALISDFTVSIEYFNSPVSSVVIKEFLICVNIKCVLLYVAIARQITILFFDTTKKIQKKQCYNSTEVIFIIILDWT